MHSVAQLGFAWLLCAPTVLLAASPQPTADAHPPRQVASNDVRSIALTNEVSFPGEFEHQGALLLGCHELVREFPDTLADLVEAVAGRVPFIALVADYEDNLRTIEALQAHGLRRNAVRFAAVPHDTMWARDYGPIFVRHANGTRAAVDGQYGLVDRQLDESVPQRLAACLRIPLRRAPLQLAGGNLLSNGQGLCITTTAMVDDNFARGFDESGISEVLREYLGVRQVVFLEPLNNESTGHVDMFATFTNHNTVVVGAYAPTMDPVNAAILDRNAATLARVKTAGGRLHVVRIPMPPNDDKQWRTYTNVVYANGVALVPTYARIDEQGRQQALATYAALLPGWHIASVDASDLISLGGALHCIALNLELPGPLPKFPQPLRRQIDNPPSPSQIGDHLPWHLPEWIRPLTSNFREHNDDSLNRSQGLP